MPLPLPRLNDDLPDYHTIGLFGIKFRPVSNRQYAEGAAAELRESGNDWLPIPNREGWSRNGKGQLRFSPNLEKLGPRKPVIHPQAQTRLEKALDDLNTALDPRWVEHLTDKMPPTLEGQKITVRVFDKETGDTKTIESVIALSRFKAWGNSFTRRILSWKPAT